MSQTIGLLGNGGQADETELYGKGYYEVSFRAVSAQYLKSDTPKLIDIQAEGDVVNTPVIAAVGPPGVRRELLQQWPGTKYAHFISPKAYVDDSLIVGAGTVISPGVVITTGTVIGQHVLVNVGATISHDCKLGDYATVSPGVHIAGRVELGAGVFVGIGATISNNIKIAAGSVIGAGAVVVNDITEENSVVVGVPGKVIKKNDGWLREI